MLAAPEAAGTESSPDPSVRRSLWPREHGAYVQLVAPMVTALVSGRPRGAAVLFLVAAAAAFLANEPLCVVAGLRGQRARRTAGERAARSLWWLAIAFVVCATAGAWLAPGIALVAGVPAAVGLALVPLAARRLERSTAGEVVAATALSGAALPVALASGVPLGAAVAAWMAWTAGLGSLTLAVRQTIARARRGRPVPASLAVGGPAVLSGLGWLLSGELALLGALPLLVCAAVLFRWPPSPRRLRAVGWSLAAATVTTAAVIAWSSPAHPAPGDTTARGATGRPPTVA